MKIASICSLMFAFVVSTHAGTYIWNDKVQLVINNGDGVHFTTAISCPNWCKVNPGWSEFNKKMALSQLLSAQATGASLVFYWETFVPGSSTVVPVWSSPSVIANQPQ